MDGYDIAMFNEHSMDNLRKDVPGTEISKIPEKVAEKSLFNTPVEERVSDTRTFKTVPADARER